MYYPGWIATINELPTKIFRVNAVFRAVVVPPGKNTVKFKYYNEAFHRGVLISTVSWSLVVLYLLITFFFQYKRKMIH
jgi:uncharacterized membrane protein YfhO